MRDIENREFSRKSERDSEEELHFRIRQARSGQVPVNEVTENIREELLKHVPHESFMLSEGFYSHPFVNYSDLIEHYPEEMLPTFFQQDKVPIRFQTVRDFTSSPQHHLQHFRYVGWEKFEDPEQENGEEDIGILLESALTNGPQLKKLDLPSMKTLGGFVQDLLDVSEKNKARIQHLSIRTEKGDPSHEIRQVLEEFPAIESLTIPVDFMTTRDFGRFSSPKLKSITFTYVHDSLEDIKEEQLLSFAPALEALHFDGEAGVTLRGTKQLFELVDPYFIEKWGLFCIYHPSAGAEKEDQVEAFRSLFRFKNSRIVNVFDFPDISDELFIEFLGEFQQLEDLSISRMDSIQVDSLKEIALHSKISDLYIYDCGGFAEEEWEALGNIQQLQSLSIYNTLLTDEDLGHLKNLKNLMELVIDSGEGITKNGLIELIKSLPNLFSFRVERSGGGLLSKQDIVEVEKFFLEQKVIS